MEARLCKYEWGLSCRRRNIERSRRDAFAESVMTTLSPRRSKTMRRAGCVGVLLTAFLSMGILPSRAADISYVYDNLGRLLAVIDPATDTAVYAYDAVGNLAGITRQASTTKTVLQFTPASGPVGTTVTIYGTGFSATPASNTVMFNGTTATVLTASTTVLTANVPAAATTGPISVTVGGITATSAASFTVGTAGAPTLAGFSPAVGNYGATVTLTGTNYDTTVINNRVAFAGAIGAVDTATGTTLTLPVPSTAQTGPLSVSTFNGQATSSQEFYVAPPGVVATEVQYTGRITVDGPTAVASITTTNKTGLMVFDGTAGQQVSIGFSGVTVPQFAASVYRPDGAVMTTPVPTFNTNGGSLDLGGLPLTGTYTIVLDPVSTYTGNITVTVSTELTGTITPRRRRRADHHQPRGAECPVYVYGHGWADDQSGRHLRDDYHGEYFHPQTGWQSSRGAHVVRH